MSGYPDLGDSRYNLFDSGWYWSVRKVADRKVGLSSPSLLEQEITVPDHIPLDEVFQRNFPFEDNSGKKLVGLEAQVILGEGNDLYSFLITANRETLDAEIARFTGRLTIILCVFAFSMIAATYFLVKIGLGPLHMARRKLGDVRAGNAESITGEFPEEIEPLIAETNALIKSNNTIVERARTQVGNLAHSLKTPLAVLNNEIASVPENKKKLFQEQLKLMQQQVQVYLDRARISARSTTAMARTDVASVLVKLVNVVAKLNPDKKLKLMPGEEGVLIFLGEEHDLQEVLGNLIENAAKFAKSEIRVSARLDAADNAIITLVVEDDGRGMSEEQVERALKRGGRVDEGGVGWGLGMSIVRDITDEYEGQLFLEHSNLGGLKAIINLPGQLETS